MLSLISSVLCGIAGIYLMIVGGLIWKKEKIKLINKNNYSRVKEADKPAYCNKMGQGNFIVGLGSLLIGINIYYFDNIVITLAGMIFIILGFYVIIKAQLKYNGSLA